LHDDWSVENAWLSVVAGVVAPHSSRRTYSSILLNAIGNYHLVSVLQDFIFACVYFSNYLSF
jgi:hypothetical protein